MVEEKKKKVEKVRFQFDPNIELDFEGGQISSDTGLLLYREFEEKIGLMNLVKTNISFKRPYRTHSNTDCIRQQIYSLLGDHEDNNDAEYTKEDPTMKKIVGKEELSSQPTLCRFENSFEEENISQLQKVNSLFLDRAYQIEPMEEMIVDLDSSDDKVHGNQIGAAYNAYYKDKIFHPLFCFEGKTGDCLKADLRPGTDYDSQKVADFLKPILKKYKKKGINLKFRGDSEFAVPEVYRLCEDEETKAEYFIRLRINPALERLYEENKDKMQVDQENQNIRYGEFYYQAGSWEKARRVLVKEEKKPDELFPEVYFVVTNSEAISPKEGIEFYCDRGTAENYLKEGKLGFHWDRLSCEQFHVNACRLQIMVLAYNLNNLMRRLCLPENFRKYRIETLRSRLIKVGSKVSKHARKFAFHCPKSFPFKEIFLWILKAIQRLVLVPVS